MSQDKSHEKLGDSGSEQKKIAVETDITLGGKQENLTNKNDKSPDDPAKNEHADANFRNTDEDFVAQKPNLTTTPGSNLTGLQSNNTGATFKPAPEETKQASTKQTNSQPVHIPDNDEWNKLSAGDNPYTGFGNSNPYGGFGNSYSMEDNFSGAPEISDVDTAADAIITKSNIVVFTGPGISAGSMIPDFKTEQATWTLKNGQDKIDVKKLLTKKFFDDKPEEVWRWHHQFRKMVINSAPNDAHYTLADMHRQCREIGITFTLITQNIDSFHVDSYIRSESKSQKNYFEETKGGGIAMDQYSENFGFCKDVYEVNGNINYMRCAKGCCKKLFPSPLGCAEYFVPQCPECKGIARPHTKFNDEDYDNYFNKYSEVLEKIVFPDCIIMVGAALDSDVATSMVTQAMSSGALIVEIGSAPCIEFGNVKQLIGFIEELVPMLCKALRERLQKFMPPTQ